MFESKIRKLQKNFQRQVINAAMVLSARAEESLGQPGPPSQPGEYPRRQTGNLMNSVNVEYDSDGMGAKVTITAEYARFLAARDRKMMDDIARENRDAVMQALRGSR
jgi:hypothetical protein